MTDTRNKELRASLRRFVDMRACVRLYPGAFELGTEHADRFYLVVDQVGAILMPGAFQEPSHAGR